SSALSPYHCYTPDRLVRALQDECRSLTVRAHGHKRLPRHVRPQIFKIKILNRSSIRMKKSLVLALGAVMVASPALAQDEPVLNVYNWSDYIAEDTIANFEAETGIKVNYDVYDSNDIVDAKLLAGNSGYGIIVPWGHFVE